MQKKSGFTLAELLIALVILVILGIVAIPRYFDVKAETQKSDTIALAEELTQINSNNYKSRVTNSAKGIKVTNCADISHAMPEGIPEGYKITSAPVAVNSTVKCSLTGLGSTTATFSVTGVN